MSTDMTIEATVNELTAVIEAAYYHKLTDAQIKQAFERALQRAYNHTEHLKAKYTDDEKEIGFYEELEQW